MFPSFVSTLREYCMFGLFVNEGGGHRGNIYIYVGRCIIDTHFTSLHI